MNIVPSNCFVLHKLSNNQNGFEDTQVKKEIKPFGSREKKGNPVTENERKGKNK
jgi:hypothetical protein